MEITLNQLRVFAVVAQTCNFTRAAEELCLSQPAVSAQIHSLERGLGVRLFEQMGKRVFLTEAGQKLLPYAEDIIALAGQLEKVVDDVRQTASGKLRLATTTTIAIHLLPPILSDFQSKYNKVQVLLKVCKSTDEIVQGVIHNVWDLGVLASSLEHPDLQHPGIEVDALLRDQLVVIVGLNHPWVGRNEVRIDELVGQPIILYEQGSRVRNLIDEELDRRGLILNVMMEANNSEVIKQAVEREMGISIVGSYSVSTEGRNPDRLHVLKLAAVKLEFQVYLIIHKNKYQTATIKAFRGLLHSVVVGR